MRDGSILAAFGTSKPAKALALKNVWAGARVALLTDDELQVRGWTGALLSSMPVPKDTAPELGFEGRWVVFSTGRVIRAFDTRTERASVLTVADGRVNGLSIEGHRVAWIERRGDHSRGKGRDRIRAINLAND